MPVHWIYDETKLDNAIKDPTSPEFNVVASCPFYDSSKFPGHYEVGQPSPYGEQLLAYIEAAKQSSDTGSLAVAFKKWADSYTGRIDHALKEFMSNVEGGIMNTGADDSQAQCLYKAIVALAVPTLDIETLISTHQHNELALVCGTFFYEFLKGIVLEEKSPSESYKAIKGSAATSIKDSLDIMEQNLDIPTKKMLRRWANADPSRAHGGISCQNPEALIRTLHIVLRAKSYEDGIRQNLMVGGDNCSTSISVGASLGAVYGVPPSWENQAKF
eukprot:CAMPEP_0194283708 /NCGR_PEP_ID=MMETSP0169-20130528/25988_1 /TAXON_ID=218684 /ORGANISM="Corethron pennatum, Strain L29A3" /LENGTH=272 /DNA_ID=CAMNT_0039029373 /DNA_START=123 /DNA_END=941 /DNA_ORIENTATION=-